MKNIFYLLLSLFVIWGTYSLFFSKHWKLSLYKNGETTARYNYDSKKDCLSAGNSYEIDGGYIDRFDCGYKCSGASDTDLKNGLICKQICNNGGCR